MKWLCQFFSTKSLSCVGDSARGSDRREVGWRALYQRVTMESVGKQAETAGSLIFLSGLSPRDIASSYVRYIRLGCFFYLLNGVVFVLKP